MDCSTCALFCGKCDAVSFFKFMVVVVPEVNVWLDIIQIPESEMALQSVMDKEESLFLSKMLVFERSLKKI